MSNESHPAPAAPQAEPMADSDADYWLRNRQAILDAIERAGFVLMSNASGFWLHPRGKTDTQAEPKREPVGTLTIRDDMGAEITFHRSFTMRPRQTFAIYPNWDLLTHDIPTRGAFVVNAPKEIGNEFLPFHPAPAAPDGWKLVPVEPTQAMNNAGLSAVNQHGKRLVWETYKAMLAAAPAAPQAEPIDPHMIVADDRFPDAQAEPKRQPVSEATALIEWPESAKWKNRAAPEGIERSCMGEPKRGPLSDERIAEIQRAAYERAAQECIETAAELRRCADGCTDGRYDWKADGADDCADAIRALGRQHD